MNHPFVYVGCFIKYRDFQNSIKGIRINPLENDIQEPHITFAYKPQEVNQSLFGKTVKIKIIGYGNDGVNEGVKVDLSSSNPILQFMIEKLETPHITIAISNEGKPVNTKNLKFEKIEPIELIGKFGGYAKWGKVIVRERKTKKYTISI